MKLDLWADLSFHREIDLMILQPHGVVDEPYVEKVIDLMERAEDEAERPFNRYIDLSKLEEIDLSFEYVFQIGLYRRLAYGERPPIKSAFHVIDRATAEVALTHAAATAGSPIQARVFLSKEGAADWLDVSITDLELYR